MFLVSSLILAKPHRLSIFFAAFVTGDKMPNTLNAVIIVISTFLIRVLLPANTPQICESVIGYAWHRDRQQPFYL